MTAQAMLEQMRTALGWGEPNEVHRWYAARQGAYFGRGSTPWCQMTVTWASYYSGNYAVVCPRGDRAYTVWSAEDGEALGLWYEGTAANIRRYALPGAAVYMDWGGTDLIGAIDHVAIAEVNLGDGRVQTIEGNTADSCRRRVRGAADIAGFWNPAYDGSTPAPPPVSAPTSMEDIVKDLPLLKQGSKNYSVKTLRAALFARGGLAEASYGGDAGLRVWLERIDFDAALTADVKAFQAAKKLAVDGEVGQQTWPRLLLP